MSDAPLEARVLHAGSAAGEALVLDEPLSFWGGFDAASGIIVDRHHPQRGASIAGRFLVLPESRGSAGTPAGVAEAVRRGTGPVGIVLGRADMNVAIGALVAAKLYAIEVPVLVIGDAERSRVRTGDRLRSDNHGMIYVSRAG